MPLSEQIAGSVHGILFILYVVAVGRAARPNRWPFERIFGAFVASLYPLGTFLLDRKLRTDAAFETHDFHLTLLSNKV